MSKSIKPPAASVKRPFHVMFFFCEGDIWRIEEKRKSHHTFTMPSPSRVARAPCRRLPSKTNEKKEKITKNMGEPYYFS